MELIYTGGHDAVQVHAPELGNFEPEVAHGKSFDFPDALAARLLEQPDNWQRREPEVPLDERIAAARTSADLDTIAAELELDFDDETKTNAQKKAALEAAAAASLNDSNDDSTGVSGEEQ